MFLLLGLKQEFYIEIISGLIYLLYIGCIFMSIIAIRFANSIMDLKIKLDRQSIELKNTNTQLNETNQQLRDNNKELKDIAESRQNLLLNVSHELRAKKSSKHYQWVSRNGFNGR